MAIPLSLPYPYLCKVEINNESLKTGNMKIIDLTKESFVEKVADYQSYPDNWEYKGNKPCLVWLLQGIITHIGPISRRI